MTSVAQPAWPPPSELLKHYGDAVKQTRPIHTSITQSTCGPGEYISPFTDENIRMGFNYGMNRKTGEVTQPPE